MKFRGKMTDSSYVQHLARAIQIISKFSKHSVVRISVDGMFFISFDETGERHPLIWFKIPQQQYFAEYNLVGVSEQFNEICLRFSPNMLHMVLSSFKPSSTSPRALKISLTNRRSPCLTCELFKIDSEPVRLCLHDIPVEVIPRKEWVDIATPEITLSPNLTLTLPEYSHLESIWDKLRGRNQPILVLANGRGALSLRIETQMSDVTFHFKDLNVAGNEDIDDLDAFVKGRIPLSKFMLLKEMNLHGSALRVRIHIRDRKYVLFDAYYDELTIHYIIPTKEK